MKRYSLYLLTITILFFSVFINSKLFSSNFKKIDKGLYYGKFELSQKQDTGNSEVTIIKIDPDHFDFGLYCESEYGPEKRDVKEWIEDFQLICAVNGGMYETDYLTGSGYLKNFNHINNPDFRENWNMFFVCNPKSDSLPKAQLIDVDEENAKKIISQYNIVLQSIRMLNAKGDNVWNGYIDNWSSVTLGEDKNGNILIIYSCSIIGMKELTDELISFPIDLRKLMYLEGNIQSLYFKYKDIVIAIDGSTELNENINFNIMPIALGVKRVISNVKKKM